MRRIGAAAPVLSLLLITALGGCSPSPPSPATDRPSERSSPAVSSPAAPSSPPRTTEPSAAPKPTASSSCAGGDAVP